MSTSYIPEQTKRILWGKAAGRCQYQGCNKCLFQDKITKAEFNQAYIAHIIADKPGGPRGDIIRSELLKNKLSNLMLMCDEHHRLIDKVDIAGHPESLLLEMKRKQEERIRSITDISEVGKSHLLIYRANVGKNTPFLTYQSLSPYLLKKKYYPADSKAIDLSLSNSPQRDKNLSFWITELENLETQFNEQIRHKLRQNKLAHFSIFAFAPIPLLIKLGTLINDIQRADIHQPIRKPATWNLAEIGKIMAYQVISPKRKFKQVALNLSLSATINNDRITKVLGTDCSIYTVTIKQPFNDFLKCKQQLENFSKKIRLLFDTIKSNYNSKIPLHIFPAIPIAIAIEVGRIWMPKADMPLIIYDENTSKGGFLKAVEINNIL